MISNLQNKTHINSLSPKPGITIWYAKTADILQSIFRKGKDHDFQPHAFRAVRSEAFKAKDFVTPVFNDGELSIINSFKVMKKQMEWISGRYMVKQMIQDIFLNTTCLDQITLSYLDQGAPFLTNHPDIPVSLSHSNDYTAVACCENKDKTIGVDIEKITKKPDPSFMKIAFTQDEILNLGDAEAVEIFKNWTIKEAYLKYIKKGFNESLHRVEIINNEIRHNNKKINVDIYSIFIGNDYVLSFVSD